MSKGFMRAVGLSCLAGILALATEAQGAATISLKAVRKNGGAITATNSVSVAPGDTIEAEVFFSGWNSPPYDGATGLVKTFQATLAGVNAAISNGADPNNLAQMVLPTTWAAPITRVSCPCTAPYVCDPVFGPQYGCTLPGFNPNTMASIATSRADFILVEYPNIASESEASLDIRWGGTIDGNDGVPASRCQGGSLNGAGCASHADCPGVANGCNQNFQSYAGSLFLKAGASVCGTTTYTFVAEANSTFLSPPGFIPNPILPTTIQGLTITAAAPCPPVPGACCNDATGVCQEGVLQNNCPTRWGGPGSTCATIEPECVAAPTGACCNDTTDVCQNGITEAACGANRWGGAGSTCATLEPPCAPAANLPIAWNPANCIIDARRPNLLNQPAQRQGITSWIWSFQGPLTAGEDAPADFTVRQVPATTPPVPPIIGSVTPGAGNALTLNFRNAGNTADFPIQPNKWTCVKHTASGVEKCLGFLPADANSNRAALPNDILDIIDSLNGVRNPPLVPHQCDIDRSGVCAPADIITQIDLLNGVNGYPNQNGDTLEVCPTP